MNLKIKFQIMKIQKIELATTDDYEDIATKIFLAKIKLRAATTPSRYFAGLVARSTTG
jgi:hypothetical protein